MMELGSGIALAGLCISAGAVGITAIRTFGSANEGPPGINGMNGKNGKNGLDIVFPCKEHSGLVVGINSIKETQGKQEVWLREIAEDVKELLRSDRGRG